MQRMIRFEKICQLTANRLFISLYSISIILFSFSMLTAEIEIGTYGLIDSLNWIYFLSVILLIISSLFSLRANDERMMWIVVITCIIMLYFVPFFLEKTPRFTFNYLVFGHVDFILRLGHSDPHILPYQNWPGMMYLGSFITAVTGLKGTGVIIIFQQLMKVVSVFFVFLLLNELVDERRTAFLGVIIYLLGDWVALCFFTPSTMGSLFFLMMIFIVIRLAFRKEINSSWNTILIITSLALIITHLLSTLTAFIAIGMLILLSKVVHYGNRYLRLRAPLVEFKRMSGLIMFGIVAFLLWIFFPVGEFTSHNFSSFLSNLGDIFSIISATEARTSGLISEYSMVMEIKMGYTFLFITLSLIGIVLCLLREKQRETNSSAVALTIVISSAILVPIIMGPYSGEIISRVFGYISPLLVFFIIVNYHRKCFIPLIILFLLISPFFFIVSAYGNEKLDYVAPVEITGVSFFYDQTVEDIPIYILAKNSLWFYMSIENGTRRPLSLEHLFDPVLFSRDNEGYIIYSEGSIEAYEYKYGKLDSSALILNLNSDSYSKLYTSDQFTLFENNNSLE